MTQKTQAYLASVLYDPQTKQADQAVVVVEYGPGPKAARVQIELPLTPIDAPNLHEQARQLLQELAEALRHIEDVPLCPYTAHRFRI